MAVRVVRPDGSAADVSMRRAVLRLGEVARCLALTSRGARVGVAGRSLADLWRGAVARARPANVLMRPLTAPGVAKRVQAALGEDYCPTDVRRVLAAVGGGRGAGGGVEKNAGGGWGGARRQTPAPTVGFR